MLVYCSSCKRETERTETQARLGTDEPATISKCECQRYSKVDVDWIVATTSRFTVSDDSSTSPTNSIRSRRSSLHSKKQVTNVYQDSVPLLNPTFVDSVNEYEIRLSGEMVKEIDFSGMDVEEISYLERGFSCAVAKLDLLVAYKARHRTSDSNYVLKRLLKSQDVAPGVSFNKSVERTIQESQFVTLHTQNLLSNYVVAVSETSFKLRSWLVRCRKFEPESSASIEIEWMGEGIPPKTEIQSVLGEFYVRFYSPVSLSAYMLREFSNSLTSYKRAVYDQRSFIHVESVFMVKVDGESSLAIDGGYFWFVTRTDSDCTVTGFVPKKCMTNFSAEPDIIHCECLADRRLVFIDLIAVDGVVLTIQRPYLQVADALPDKFLELNLVIRNEHSTLESASDELSSSVLPADGVVGICLKLGTTYRIKKPTVDLIAIDDKLCTGSLSVHKATRLRMKPGMIEGHVYECELQVESPRKYKIMKFVYRPDRVYANSRNVYDTVILNACGNAGYDIAIRRGVTDINFALRKVVYERAVNRKTNGRLLIDVGSGRLQSFSFFKDPKVSLLLCDPKLSNVSSLNRGVVHDLTHIDPASRLDVLEKLNSGRYKTAVFKGRIEDLFNTQALIDYVVDYSVPLVFSFSITHTLDFCLDMAVSGANIVGCTYLYDDADASGSVIEAFGVSMKIVNPAEREGELAFGSDRVFREYALTTEDLTLFDVTPTLEDMDKVTDVAPDVSLIARHMCRFATRMF